MSCTKMSNTPGTWCLRLLTGRHLESCLGIFDAVKEEQAGLHMQRVCQAFIFSLTEF